jgi:hypothetical protein
MEAPLKTLATILLLAVLPWAAPAQAEAPLFASDTVMKLTIPLDFSQLCRPRETEDCQFTPATLIYGAASGRKLSMPIEVKIRGGWRSLSRNCSVPLLWIRFDEEAAIGTPFEGQSLLPLTTHCGKGISIEAITRGTKRSDYEQFLLREFLAFRIYNELSEYSVRTRLVRIAYPDPQRPGKGSLHYAFFAEHFDSMAARTGSTRLPRGSFDTDRLDAQSAARVALFQFMIGNTDWSIARERNTVLLLDGEGKQVPVPYDLDMSGLVDADYAGPAPSLPIKSVRERYFLGLCQPGTDWDALFRYFDERRDAIMGLVGRLPGLSRVSKRSTRHYLEKFFDIIETPTARAQEITGACLSWPPSSVDHTTPLGR